MLNKFTITVLTLTLVVFITYLPRANSVQLESCTCLVHGDPHYRTYDGKNFAFMGMCTYLLTESKDQTGECSFSVRVANRGDTRNSYTDAIEVVFNKRAIRMGQNFSLTVGGKEVRYKTVAEGEKLQVFMTGAWMTMVSHKCGMRVEWDGMGNAFIRINKKQNANKVIGLCGNCNDRVEDDMTTREGKVTTDVIELGNSFIVHNTTDIRQQCRRQTPPLRPHPCTREWENKVRTPEYCGAFLGKDGPFAQCLAKSRVVKETLFEGCRYDVCMQFEHPAEQQQLRCAALAVYAALCTEMGIPGILWRSFYKCDLDCGPNQEYATSIEPCPTTCDTIRDGKCPCCNQLLRKEGCRCKAGFIQHGMDCIPQTKCPKLKELDLFNFVSEGKGVKTTDRTIKGEFMEVGKNVTMKGDGVTKTSSIGQRKELITDVEKNKEESQETMTGSFGKSSELAGGEQPEWLRKFMMMNN